MAVTDGPVVQCPPDPTEGELFGIRAPARPKNFGGSFGRGQNRSFLNLLIQVLQMAEAFYLWAP